MSCIEKSLVAGAILSGKNVAHCCAIFLFNLGGEI